MLGLVLAGGAGKRFGHPKALVEGWVRHRVTSLVDGGCAPVLVVLGAAADRARPFVPLSAQVVVAEDWAEGIGASLRTGLRAAGAHPVDAVLVALVDTPGLTAAAVARLTGLTRMSEGAGPKARRLLAQAAYGGRPGHPVLIGRSHWSGVVAVAQGDRGARGYLARHEVLLVECGDVADGRDVDVSPSTGTEVDR